MIPSSDALVRLREGNRRFVQGDGRWNAMTAAARAEIVTHQRPFAIVLGCSDSRAPVELIFDQGFGDLFVIRVAGNIVAPSQVGSVEFAATQFGTQLVVVLGHTGCGAVRATVGGLLEGGSEGSRSLGFIVDRIRPSVEAVLSETGCTDPQTLMALAVRSNIKASVTELRRQSAILRQLGEQGLRVIGAEYSLESGEVVFL